MGDQLKTEYTEAQKLAIYTINAKLDIIILKSELHACHL